MYARELRLNWQPLLAASLGIGLGSAISHYTTSLFGPPLLREFGWSKADFALLGVIPMVSLILVPFAGRFTDRFGTRIAAMLGFTAVPLGFVAFGLMQGSLTEYFTIWIVQHIFGILTTSLVFCRVVVERFDAARGMALSLLMTTPPLVGAIAAPALGALIEAEGWRAGYFAMAAVSAIGGLLAITLMGRSAGSAPKPAETIKLSWGELFGLVRHPTLLLIICGMLLVNIPQVFASSQMKLILMDSGATSAAATWMMSLYAGGVIVGRFISGLALDRVKPHIVAIAALGLPAVGFVILATDATANGILCIAVGLVGLAQGAEGDIGAYLVSRRFDMKNFSLLLSFVTASLGIGAALGSLILSLTLHASGSYEPFLIVSAVTTILGAILFALTGTRRARAGTREADAEATIVDQALVGEAG